MIKPSGPGEALIRQALTKSFSDVEVELKAQLKKIYRSYVDRKFEEFMKDVNDPSVTGRIVEGFSRRSRHGDWGEWVSIDSEEQRKCGLIVGASMSWWDDLRKCPKMIKKSYVQADRESLENYANARDSYIEKNLGKLVNVLSGRSDIQVVLADFAFNRGVFAGKVYVSLKNGDEITAHVSLKYVVRYIPKVTPYYQYPLLFYKAIVGKRTLTSPSEEELREAFSGTSKEKFEEKKATQALAEGWCPMSGQPSPKNAKTYHPGRGMTKCPSCGVLATIMNWKFRKHKTQAAQKTEVATKLSESGYCPMSKQKIPDDVIAMTGPVDGYGSTKILCQTCNQYVRTDSRTEWIRDKFLTDTGYPTKARIESGTYYKHKLPS